MCVRLDIMERDLWAKEQPHYIHAMHTKSELEAMTTEELTSLAASLNVKVKNSDAKIDLIYEIIGAESDQAMAAPAPAPKKRGRKSKAEKEAEAKAREAEALLQDAEATETQAATRAAEELSLFAAEQAAISGETAEGVEGVEAIEATPEAAEPKAEAKPRGRRAKAKAAEAEAETVETEPQAEAIAEAEAPADEPQTAAAPLPTAPTPPATATDEVKAFFAAEEPSFVIVRDIPKLDPVVSGEMTPEGETAQYLQTLDNMKRRKGAAIAPATPAAVPTQAQQPVRPAKGAARYDFSNLIKTEGVLELMGDNCGLLRSSDYNYLPSPDDVFVSHQMVKQWALKTGDVVEGSVRPPREGEKYFILTSVDSVNGTDPARLRDRQQFENLTPLFADEKFQLCRGYNDPISVRIVDLFSPIGKGQRALIMAQPKTGKTILMKEIANAIAANHPEAYLMMLLIDERPEEVTDMARTVNAEVIASTFDEPADHHVKIAGIVLEKAKRMVECGHDVVIFLDSITRLARAYNNVAPGSGKILTGGVDANALQRPKRFFGAARNIEGGGSLTIIATALIDTGSRMDEVIFEEFKGTGNMELQLDRTLANKRIFPAVNIVASSTRRDDLLHDKMTLQRMWILRNYLSDMNPIEAMTELKKRLEDTKTNEEFLISMNG